MNSLTNRRGSVLDLLLEAKRCLLGVYKQSYGVISLKGYCFDVGMQCFVHIWLLYTTTENKPIHRMYLQIRVCALNIIISNVMMWYRRVYLDESLFSCSWTSPDSALWSLTMDSTLKRTFPEKFVKHYVGCHCSATEHIIKSKLADPCTVFSTEQSDFTCLYLSPYDFILNSDRYDYFAIKSLFKRREKF